MEEIRFSRPDHSREQESAKFAPVATPVRKPEGVSVIKKLLKVVGVLLALVIISIGVNQARGMFKPVDPNASEYYAVFLTNGQVYFGQLKEKNNREFVLTNVYYLQLSDTATAQQELSESRFSLVKLGDELHGPTDEMFINMDNLLFYEKLKKDSKVVESIIKTNNQ